MNAAAKWIWLASLLGPCNPRLTALLREYGSIDAIFADSGSDRFAHFLGAAARRDGDNACRAAEIIESECERLGVAVLHWDSELYPKSLREITVPPALLYATGTLQVLDGVCVAGVGTRRITQYGRECTARICGELAAAGITLVSGLAFGIDAEVHRAALKAGAPTVAVLGNAIDETTPAAHRELRGVIEHSGAVLSEYPPGYRGYNKAMYPARNRIISGLSRGVIVFEAAQRSGSIITANWALDDGREVFAVPGSIFSPQSEGTNALIRQGATPVTAAADVLASLGRAPLLDRTIKRAAPALSGTRLLIYNAVAAGLSLPDDIVAKLGCPPGAVLSELSEMEIDGLLECRAGLYAIKNI